MTTTATSPSHLGALEKQPATAIAGYGLGDFAMNLAFSMTTSFLLYYLTDVAGLTAAAVGTMFLVVRLWDAFTDLFAGRMVDKTMTRFGKFRPFILWFAVPVLFLSFLNFNVPSEGVKWLGVFEWQLDDAGKLLYAYLAYAILGLVYSLINIPYGSLASAMTQSVNERAKLVASRAFGSAIGGVFSPTWWPLRSRRSRRPRRSWPRTPTRRRRPPTRPRRSCTGRTSRTCSPPPCCCSS